MLKLEKVTKVFQGNVVALDQVSFDVKKGELVRLVGPNRAGKTTLLRLIAAEAKPSRGEIIFDGMSSRDMGTKEISLWRRKLGLISDHSGLVDDMSVFDNVALGLRVLGEKERKVKRKVREVLEQVGLGSNSRTLPAHLSSAERQTAVIARAIVKNPILLLADEPAAGLDESNAREIMDLLRRMSVFGTTVLLTPRESPADGGKPGRVIRIEKGSAVQAGSPLISKE